MKKLWAMIKNNPEVAGYVGLVLLVFGACFFVEFSFVAALYIVLFAFFLRNEVKILGLILFIYCFYLIFHIGNFQVVMEYNWSYFSLINTLLDVLYVFIFLLYVKRVIRKEKKINLKLFIPMIVFLIYMALPFHECEWNDLTNVACSYLCLYVAFEIRHEIDFVYLVRIFALALILSCVFGLYYENSALLSRYMKFVPSYYNKQRYPALTFHPLFLAALALLLICSILILRYKNKISIFEFYLFFIPVFAFGYLTISRSFVITVIFAFLIFSIFYIKKCKTRSLKPMFIISMIIIFVVIIFLGETRCLFTRFENPYSSQMPSNPTDDWFNDFYEGNISVDLNRKDLFKYYLLDWSSSLQTILFGRGISRMYIGGLHSHNYFIQTLWEHGLFGCILVLLIFLCGFKIKKIKCNYLPILILLIPFGAFLMIEVLHYEFVGFLLFIAALSFLDNHNMKKNTLEENFCYINQLDSNLIFQTNIFDNCNITNCIKISIIIPVYNGEKFIKKCIDKVLQIELNKEVIVVNDGSTDGSLELLKSYGEKIILINLEQNEGVSHARNLGLERASGDYVSFIDIDDDFELDMYQKIITKMIVNNADIGICRYDFITTCGRKIKVQRSINYENKSQLEVIQLYLNNELFHAVWTSVYKSSIVKSIKFEEEIRMGEDTLYQLKALLNAQKTCFIDEVLYHYIKNDTSVTNAMAYPKNVMGYVKIRNYLNKYELERLENGFNEEFEYFKLLNLVNSINLVAQYGIKNRKKILQVKEFIRNYGGKEFCNKIISNKKISRCYRIEFFILKKFGVNFYLFIFPFLKFGQRFIYWLKLYLKK